MFRWYRRFASHLSLDPLRIEPAVAKRRQIIPYDPKLKERARELRKKMTLAEILLWKQLNRRKMRGYDFDRQRPIDRFIVDFYCKDLSLAIEVDGSSHEFREATDIRRQRRLESVGVRILRFWDTDVRNDMPNVLRTIEEWIEVNGNPRVHSADDPPRPAGTPPRRGLL